MRQSDPFSGCAAFFYMGAMIGGAYMVQYCDLIEIRTDQSVGQMEPAIEMELVEVEPTPIDEVTQCPSPVVEPATMAKVIEGLRDDRNRDKFLLWQEDYYPEGDAANVRVVYVRKGVRYTVWYNPDYSITSKYDGSELRMEGHIAVWERPDGTKSDKVLAGYSDDGLEGCINSGGGDPASHGRVHWNEDYSEDEGLEYHAQVQEHYNKAILALADVLDVR